MFLRGRWREGNTQFTDDNVVLFLHGATGPSTCDFDLSYKDYSWADLLVREGYVVYMGDYRNYGYSTREPAMDEPAAKNAPLSRSYLALRDIEAMVDHIKRTHNVKKVTLIGWSWGAMMAGYYARCIAKTCRSSCFTPHCIISTTTPILARAARCRTSASRANLTSLWAPTASRQRRQIPAAGMARYRSTIKMNIATRSSRRILEGMHGHGSDEQHAQSAEPTGAEWCPGRFLLSGDRPPAMERRNIYVPTLVIAGQFDTWSYPEDREGLMRDLVHAPVKKSVLIQDATHFVLFEKQRNLFFGEISKFLKE